MFLLKNHAGEKFQRFEKELANDQELKRHNYETSCFAIWWCSKELIDGVLILQQLVAKLEIGVKPWMRLKGVLLKMRINEYKSLDEFTSQYVGEWAATQNMLKYTQAYWEIEVLTDTSYCFNVYALAIASNTLLTSSCTLHSRKFPK